MDCSKMTMMPAAGLTANLKSMFVDGYVTPLAASFEAFACRHSILTQPSDISEIPTSRKTGFHSFLNFTTGCPTNCHP